MKSASEFKEVLPPALMDLVEQEDVEYQMTRQQDNRNVILKYQLPLSHKVALEEEKFGIESKRISPTKTPSNITVVYPKRNQRARRIFLACALSQVILAALFVAFVTQSWVKSDVPDVDSSNNQMVLIGINDTFGVNELLQGEQIGDSTCTNDPFFLDEYGWDCEWYEENEDEGCPKYGDCADVNDNLSSANAACCHCGGGIPLGDENTPSNEITAEVTTAPSESCNETTVVEVDKACYEPGEEITLSFINCVPEVDDWLGIFEDIDNVFNQGTYWVSYWNWACGTQQCEVPASRGTVSFQEITQLETGSFRAHLRRNKGDDMSLATSSVFQILEDCLAA